MLIVQISDRHVKAQGKQLYDRIDTAAASFDGNGSGHGAF